MADNPNHIKTTLRQKTNDGIDSTKEIYPKTTIDQLYNEAGTTHFNDESFSKPLVAGTGIDFTAVPDSPVGAKSISVDLTDLKAVILDMLYPVGSIYMSDSTGTGGLCPIAVGLGGTWVQLKDRFLLGAGDNYTAGNTGGSDTKTLSVANLPSHNHSINLNTSETGAHTHTVSDDTTHLQGVKRRTTDENSNGSRFADYSDFQTRTTTTDGNHLHNVSGDTDSTGDGTAFDIMPPYLVVYMWKRTA